MSESQPRYTTIERCRSCGNDTLELVLGLGLMPLSDGLVEADSDRDLEDRYPLTLVRCAGCSLPQILETVEPKTLYGDDPPDFLAILAWNFKDEIIRQQSEYAELGGKFVVPIPNPMVL